MRLLYHFRFFLVSLEKINKLLREKRDRKEKKRKDKKGVGGKSEETFVFPCGYIYLIVLNLVA